MIGQQIQNYKILSLLGEGGMANVYLAEHISLRNKVAIKILKEDYVQNANIRKRFLAEARSLAQMSHPNIIKVTDLIDAGDIVAFVMEYIEGQTLEAYLSKKGELARAEIEGFFNQMILAVEYVHEQGLIHRDIKPSNFMVTKNGQIKLLDFGIAKNTNEGAVDYTKTGLMQQMGTPLYMSPEQIECVAPITKLTDIYSLGVTLWCMVMGQSPYNLKDISILTLQNKIHKEPLPLTHTIWDSSIQQATEKDPTKRSLKINYNKILEVKSVSDKEINFAPPKENLKKEEPKRIAYFNFKTISITIGILLFVGILIIGFSKYGMADGPVTTISDDKKPEIVLPSKDKPVLKEVKPITIEPKLPPKEKEKHIEVVKPFPIPHIVGSTISKSTGFIVSVSLGADSPFTGITFNVIGGTIISDTINKVPFSGKIIPGSLVAKVRIGKKVRIEVFYTRNGVRSTVPSVGILKVTN